MSCQKLVYEYIYTYRAHWSDPAAAIHRVFPLGLNEIVRWEQHQALIA